MPAMTYAKRALVTLVMLAIAVAGASLTPTAGAAAPSAVPATAKKITYTAQTVEVAAKTVKKQLLAVSGNGATYTFKTRKGQLRKLKKGKVMLLDKLAVRRVTKTKVKHHHLVVTTKPAAITDLIKSGTLSKTAPIRFSKGYVVSGSTVPPEFRRAAGPLPPAALMGMQRLSAAHAITVSGEVKGYDWEAKFRKEKSAVGVDITITRKKPVKLSVTISGTLHNFTTASNISVNKGKLSQAKLLANSLSGDFTLSYSAQPTSAFGLGQDGGIKVDLPAEIMVPFFVGPVPFFVGVRVSIFASAGFSSFSQKLEGSWKMSYDGAGGITTSNSGATTPAGVLSGLAKIVLDAANAVKTGPISFVFGAQMPQIQLGLGVKGFNVAGNVTLIGSSGIATYGSGCDTRKMEVEGTAGANANFFGLSADLGTATLFDKVIQKAYPAGCGTFPS